MIEDTAALAISIMFILFGSVIFTAGVLVAIREIFRIGK